MTLTRDDCYGSHHPLVPYEQPTYNITCYAFYIDIHWNVALGVMVVGILSWCW